MKTRLIYLFSITTSLILASCSNDDDAAVVDTQAPQISIVEPHNEDGIAPGGEIHFEAVFTDNVELASYKIEVHSDFDGHTHSGVKQENQDNPWSYSEVFTIPAGQTSFDAENHIAVPTEINGEPVSEGHYHFGVYVTDVAGNEEQSFLELHIEGDAEGEEHTH